MLISCYIQFKDLRKVVIFANMASAPREQLRLDVDNDKSFKNII